MGSFKNKINNKKKKKMENEALNELIDLKKTMKAQFEAEEYVEAMDTMAKIAEHKKMDPEVMFMGATCYFMTGDHERAARWVNNTLAYDPNNVGARLLLARLCFIEDKPDNGFAVLNFIVDNQQTYIKDKEKEKLLELLEYCHNNMTDTMQQHASLVEYFSANHVVTSSCTTPAASKPEDSSDNYSQSKAKAAVDRLKSLLKKSKGNSMESTPIQVESKERDNQSTVGETQNVSAEAPDYFIDKVMSSNISLREKVQSLNNFASGLYLNGDYDGALQLLKKALELDSRDPFILRNIAYVCVAMKDNEKALDFAKALPMMDFGLLQAIKG